MSTISINEMHPYEKVMEIMKEFPNLNETVGSTSNNLYSGDEFDEDQISKKQKSVDTPTTMNRAQRKFIEHLHSKQNNTNM